MTITIMTRYTVGFMMFALMAVIAPVQASEVTGVLSSNTATSSAPTGDLNGTVTSSGGGSSSGGSSNRSNGSSNNAQDTDTASGSVLGATASNAASPGFPNAGIAPAETLATPSLWSTIMAFMGSIFSR